MQPLPPKVQHVWRQVAAGDRVSLAPRPHTSTQEQNRWRLQGSLVSGQVCPRESQVYDQHHVRFPECLQVAATGSLEAQFPQGSVCLCGIIKRVMVRTKNTKDISPACCCVAVHAEHVFKADGTAIFPVKRRSACALGSSSSSTCLCAPGVERPRHGWAWNQPEGDE